MLKRAATLLLAAVLTACSTNSNNTQSSPGPKAAPTLTVTANPTTVTAGLAATLTWDSTNASSVSFDNGMGTVALSGSSTATPTATTTFHGTATGPGGTAQASVTVNVVAAQSLQLTANPTTITQGQSSTLTVSAPGATSVSIDQGVGTVPASGTVKVTPTATTTYTGTATFTGGATLTATATVTVTASGPTPTVMLSANPSTVNQGQSSTLSWSSTNATSLTIDQGVGSVTAPSGSTIVSPSATTVYTITASNGASTATASATVSVNSSVSQLNGMFTFKYDNSRTGQDLNEGSLTPANVNISQFGKKFTFNVDGYVYAQPLYVQGVTMAAGGTYNAVYVATEHDSVFAFDADGDVTTPLWQVNFTNPTAGITTVPTGDVGSTIYPEIGITSTPVIDPSSGTIYVEASTKENGSYFHRLHALDLTSGVEKFGGPVVISGSVPGNGAGNDGQGNVPFQPKIELQRSALLLVNGNIYVAFASHGDNGEFHGWIFAYNAANLSQAGIWNSTPNGQDGGIWQGGGGLAADSAGSIYGITGNGSSDQGPDYGDSFLRLTLSSSEFTVDDYFTPFNQQYLSTYDIDVGSGGPLILPDQPGSFPHLITGAGKEGTIYLLDRDNLGHYSTSVDNVVQEIANALGSASSDNTFCTPSYWQNRVYYVGSPDVAKAFTLSGGLLSTKPESESTLTFGFPGATPVISASGNTNGILWALERDGNELHAYDATNLANELYNSGQAGARDSLGTVVRFTVPMVANGRVYVGTKSTLVVYGLF
jgi:hypothetical protein